MSNEQVGRIERETCPNGAGHVHDAVNDLTCNWSYQHTRAVIAAMTPTPQVVDSTCTCPSGDGSLRWPCPQHPPTPDVGVLAEVRALPHAVPVDLWCTYGGADRETVEGFKDWLQERVGIILDGEAGR